jgi:RNA polymerase-binding transcription factor DksA
MKMNDKDRSRLEELLLGERERRLRALDRIDEQARISTEDDGDLTQYKQHPADEGTDTMEQEKTLSLLSMESETLNRIDEALLRLYKEPERAGLCERCGDRIQMDRLEVVPWAVLCIECQSLQESAR